MTLYYDNGRGGQDAYEVEPSKEDYRDFLDGIARKTGSRTERSMACLYGMLGRLGIEDEFHALIENTDEFEDYMTEKYEEDYESDKADDAYMKSHGEGR